MDKDKLNILLKQANLSKKEFASLLGISAGSLNNWGSSQNIPYWVKTWLENYIKSKSYEDVKDKVFEIEGVKK